MINLYLCLNKSYWIFSLKIARIKQRNNILVTVRYQEKRSMKKYFFKDEYNII